MVLLLASLLRCFLNVFSSRKTILSENAVLGKENEILLQKVGKKLMFNIDFLAYNLVSIKTTVEAPNMNSIMERFFRSGEQGVERSQGKVRQMMFTCFRSHA